MSENIENTIESSTIKGTSFLGTIMNLLRINVGSGLFVIPYAFKNSGLLIGSLLIWLIALTCTHCMHILVKCNKFLLKNEQNLPKNLEFDRVVELVLKQKFGTKISWLGRIIISLFIFISQIGFCCVFYIFIANNIKQIIDYYKPQSNLSIQIIMVIILPFLIAFSFIKSLRILSWFSLLANFLMLFSIIVILYECISSDKLKFDQVKLVQPLIELPFYLNAVIYAYASISLVLPIYNDMNRKELFTPWYGALNITMLCVTLVCFLIGFFGYLNYGDSIKDSITLNLSISNIYFRILKIFVIFTIFVSYNLNFLIASNLLWSFVSVYIKHKNECVKFIFEQIIRSLLVCVTLLLSAFIPRFNLIVSIVGAVTCSTMALIVPPLMDLILFYSKSKRKWIILLKNIFILIFGCSIFLTGTYVSISDILKFLNKP